MSDLVANLNLTARYLNIIVGSSMFIFGLIGNLLTISLFTRTKFRKATSARYLTASALANLVQLLLTLLLRILGDGFAIPLVKSNTPFCQARNLIAAVATLCSLSYPCWASFDHFISTSRNAATRHFWTSKRFVYFAIVATIFVWLIVYLPLVLFTQAIGEYCVGTSTVNTYIYSYGVSPLVYSVLPIVVISYFHVGIIRHLRQSRVVNMVQGETRLVKQVRRMLIPQLMIIIVSGIPLSVQTVYAVLTLTTPKDSVRLAVENMILTIVRLLFYVNYICSFYIYVTVSGDFRREFKKLILKRNTILPQRAVENGTNTNNT